MKRRFEGSQHAICLDAAGSAANFINTMLTTPARRVLMAQREGLCEPFVCVRCQPIAWSSCAVAVLLCPDARVVHRCSARCSARRTGGGAWPPAAGHSRPPAVRSPLRSMQRRSSWNGARPTATARSRYVAGQQLLTCLYRMLHVVLSCLPFIVVAAPAARRGLQIRFFHVAKLSRPDKVDSVIELACD